MRTTVTLDPETEQIVRRRMRERRLSFKEAVNELIKSGVSDVSQRTPQFETHTVPMGESRVNLDRALQVVGEVEDAELIRKMRAGS